MYIGYKYDFENNIFYAEARYLKKEISENQFLLNLSFCVKKIVCDNKEVEVKFEIVNIKNDEYIVKKYFIPEFEDDLYIEYIGILDGTTGFCPYVKETINSEFTFIRFETFC